MERVDDEYDSGDGSLRDASYIEQHDVQEESERVQAEAEIRLSHEHSVTTSSL